MKQLIRRFPRVHNSAKPFQIQSSNVFVAVLSSDIVSVLILCSLFSLSATSPPSCATLAGVYGWCDVSGFQTWGGHEIIPHFHRKDGFMSTNRRLMANTTDTQKTGRDVKCPRSWHLWSHGRVAVRQHCKRFEHCAGLVLVLNVP